ncbi:hypothetical protein CEP54_013834 [Fusarium duplospermum]|uniref:Heterokaryon incompatibility domain-containing protein n=1 Tax=Fusarium duplospermum TaxID=1325734 RepID=A0A428P0F0_9HYPO|nr:hypothetical protein CEP54_013834 [Fusarium duplospermum]
MIFVDFSDAEALEGESPQDAYDLLVPDANKWYQEISYGQLDLNITADTSKFYRMPNSAESYGWDSGLSNQQHYAYVEDALDAYMNNGENPPPPLTDILYVVPTRNAAWMTRSLASSFGAFTSNNTFVSKRAITFGVDPYNSWGYKALNHETGHSMCLPDLYPLDLNFPTGEYVGGYSVMGNVGGIAPDFFAWDKWRLGWLADEDGGTKAVVVAANKTSALVAEARTAKGADEKICAPGILLYTIDTTRSTGEGPIRVLDATPGSDSCGSEASGWEPLNDATLSVRGTKSYEVSGWGIKVSLMDDKDAASWCYDWLNNLAELIGHRLGNKGPSDGSQKTTKAERIRHIDIYHWNVTMDTWNNAILSSLYSPLLGKNPLRVLRLEPGTRSDPIICQLIPTYLDAIDNAFIAMSYTWGSLQDPQKIQCNGYTMTVQQNAFDLLNDLRLPGQPRTIWIDAICINQGDVSERSEQVQMMHMIYSRAQSVMIWLGRADDHSRAAMAFAASLDVDKYFDEFIRHQKVVVDAAIYRQKTYLLGHPLESAEEKQRAVSIVSFINRPWFSRIWVQQEGSVNKNTKVVCGTDMVDWNAIFALGWIMQPPRTTFWPDYLPYTYEESKNNLMAMNNIQIYKVKAFPSCYSLNGYNGRTRSFLTLLLYTSRFAATDPRDKIFALSGLHLGSILPGSHDWIPKADYTIPWEVLYTDVTLWNLERGWLNTLSIAGRARQPRDSILPSWVPDYRQSKPQTEATMLELVTHNEWMAGGQWQENGHGCIPDRRLMAKKHRLPASQRRPIERDLMSLELCRSKRGVKNILQTYISLSGLMMDEICYVGSTLSSCKREGQWTRELYQEFIQQDLDYIHTNCSKTYMNGDPATEAYKLAIISATNHDQELVDTKYTLDNWDSWRHWLIQDDCDLDSIDQDTPVLNRAIQNSGIFREFRFAVTKHGYFCLVPSITQVRDRVAILSGYMAAIALRPGQYDEYFELLGDAYIHGMMTNEANCIISELDCKADPTDEQRDRILQNSKRNNGEAWRTLKIGDYTSIINTLGKRRINFI